MSDGSNEASRQENRISYLLKQERAQNAEIAALDKRVWDLERSVIELVLEIRQAYVVMAENEIDIGARRKADSYGR